ncbi:MAG: immune inhibitor A [Flavobacteriales bacterium]|nr:immune inhibitor A [Flavobacteriales bacterium]
MRHLSLLVAFFASSVLLAQAPQRYARARIALDSPAGGMQQLAALGLAIDHASIESGIAITAELSEAELGIARAHGFPVQMLIDDVSEFYRARSNEKGLVDRGGGEACNAPDAWPEPNNWQLGSMAGFFTLGELNGQLDAMRAAYPQLITAKVGIGAGHEGRPIHMVRLSDNADADQERPELLYTALHHAREPVSASQLIYFLWHLLENYGTDAEATYVLDHFELYVVPCLNPDGYAYNEMTDPGGGGMWRKNRRDNGDGTFGVDLNRNYAQGWAFDDLGSSADGASDVYRGPAPFSEPETQAIRDLCNAHEFRMALNYHAHGNLHIYPWGYGFAIYTPDSAQFVRNAVSMTRDNRYRFGTADQTVNYVVNGGSDDWMYGEQQSKPKILSCTPECGGPADWFWPPEWRIEEIGRENLRQNLRAAELCGVYAEASDRAPAFLTGAAPHARFSVKRLGLEPGPITVGISAISNVLATGNPITYPNLAELEERTDSIALQLAPGLQPGDPIEYAITISHRSLTWQFPVKKLLGAELLLFSDDCSSLANWTTNGWGVEADPTAAHSPCLTDSPGGNYPAQANRSLTLAQPVDLSNAVAARLTFKSRWDIEGRLDGVQALGSTNGIAWEPLCGRYTRPGFADQGEGDPVYDAQMPHWVDEEFDLAAYCGGPFRIRFTLRSNGNRQFDGFRLDDVAVLATQLTSGMVPVENSTAFHEWPSPASDQFNLRLPSSLHSTQVHVDMINPTGQLVLRMALIPKDGVVAVPVIGMAEGIYQCLVSGPEGFIGTKSVMVGK